MAEIQAKRNVTVESVKERSAIEGVRTAKLVKSQTSSVDIRTPNEKSLDPLVMEIIRGEIENKEEHRTDLLEYLRKSNSESDYMNVTRMLNRDGSITDAERIVHSVYGYEIAKETLKELDDESATDDSMKSLTETIESGFKSLNESIQHMEENVVMTVGKLSESSETLQQSLSRLTETIEKNASALTRTLEEGINRLLNGDGAYPADEMKPSHKKK